MKPKLSPSSALLAFGGLILMGLGMYFVFIRPQLLPEDPRFIGTTLAEIQATMPGLLVWLRRVFWVTLAPGASTGVGGFMFATGVLITYIAVTTFQQLARGATIRSCAGKPAFHWLDGSGQFYDRC